MFLFLFGFFLLTGSLGNISRFDTFSDINAVNSYLSLNVSSALALTAGILQVFPCRTDLRWTVVNVSSMFALMASPSWVLYCTAKAARMMLFNVLAQEEPNVKVLSYSPGTVNSNWQVKATLNVVINLCITVQKFRI